MTVLANLIRNIPDWNQLSAAALFTTLSQKDIPYRDDSDWTWKGIALVYVTETGQRFGREGCKKLQDALKSQGEELWVSQISSGMSLTDSEIQEVLLNLDQLGVVPGARHVAEAVLRNISLLEQSGITTTQAEVAQVQTAMKFDLYKQSKIDAAQDRLIAYREAMTVYNGVGPEPEL